MTLVRHSKNNTSATVHARKLKERKREEGRGNGCEGWQGGALVRGEDEEGGAHPVKSQARQSNLRAHTHT